MLTYYRQLDARIVATAWSPGTVVPSDVLWIDLLVPTRDEETQAELFIGMDVPTREEMAETEVSNRLYQEAGAQVMTTSLLAKVDSGAPETHPVTFIIVDCRLVTVRYTDTTSFRRYAAQLTKLTPADCDGVAILLGLLDAIVNRLADLLERLDRDLDRVTKEIFRGNAIADRARNRDYQRVLEQIGQAGDLSSKLHECLVTLSRVAAFAAHNKNMALAENDVELVSIRKDITGLTDHGSFLGSRINFLLDATLGMVSIQQNNVFRILSIASLIFMPPTLIAGIYGMNFKLMPELSWHWGYPMSLIVMLLSAVLPLAYLRQRKWL